MKPSPLSFARIALCDAPAYFAAVPGWRWHTTIPDYYNLWIALRGQGRMEVDGIAYPIRPGTAFVLGPGQAVQAEHEAADPVHNLAVHFRACRADGSRVRAREWPLLGTTVRNTDLLSAVTRHLVRLGAGTGWSQGSEADTWVLALLVQLLQDAHAPPRDPVDEQMLNLAEQLQANPGQRISVTTLARQTGLSRVHFTRRFAKVTGLSPSQYIIRHRIERAAHMIANSSMKMATIAESLGYEDVYFFSRQFKAVKGYPPRQLRSRS